jgi:hypothetical protein
MIDIKNSYEIITLEITNFENRLFKKMKNLRNKFNKKLTRAKNSFSISDNLQIVEFNVNSIIKLNKKINNLLQVSLKKSDFIKNEQQLYPKKVGKLLSPVLFKNLTKSMLHQFYYENAKIVDLRDNKIFKSCAMCSLDNVHLVIANTHNQLFVLNNNFETVNNYEINNLYYMRNITSICSDFNENIYLSDSYNSQILMKKMNSNTLLKSFGVAGFSKYEFLNPCAICFYNDSFYVLDQGNKRVQKYSSDCVFKKMIILSSSKTKRRDTIDCPIGISVSEDVIAVSESINSIYIYNFDGLLRIILHNLHYGVYSFICVSSHLFIHGYNGSLTCYDLNKFNENDESFLPEFERFAKEFANESTTMTFFNENLVILFKNCNYLAIV